MSRAQLKLIINENYQDRSPVQEPQFAEIDTPLGCFGGKLDVNFEGYEVFNRFRENTEEDPILVRQSIRQMFLDSPEYLEKLGLREDFEFPDEFMMEDVIVPLMRRMKYAEQIDMLKSVVDNIYAPARRF